LANFVLERCVRGRGGGVCRCSLVAFLRGGGLGGGTVEGVWKSEGVRGGLGVCSVGSLSGRRWAGWGAVCGTVGAGFTRRVVRVDRWGRRRVNVSVFVRGGWGLWCFGPTRRADGGVLVGAVVTNLGGENFRVFGGVGRGGVVVFCFFFFFLWVGVFFVFLADPGPTTQPPNAPRPKTPADPTPNPYRTPHLSHPPPQSPPPPHAPSWIPPPTPPHHHPITVQGDFALRVFGVQVLMVSWLVWGWGGLWGVVFF